MKQDDAKSMPREERLAARLRENLRRRKAQARELDESSAGGVCKSGDKS